MNNKEKISLSPIKEMELRASRIPGAFFIFHEHFGTGKYIYFV
jgi:hypothetical protein